MKYLILLLIMLKSFAVIGQSEFAHRLTFTASNFQEARRVIRTTDGNFLAVGYLYSLPMSSLDRDGLVIKLDPDGNVIWAKKYGGSNFEEFYDVQQVGDFYYCLGYTRTQPWVHGVFLSGGINLNADIFLVKLKLNGSIEWAKNMGKPSNGTSATDGNDVGLRLIASGQGGVMVVARINSGSNTNQNNGIIWVDADGKTRWAYQYDYTPSSNSNELTYSIWKDGPNSYITGGWINSFSGLNGGLLLKIDQAGSIVWDRNTRCSPGTFESQYFGYYNPSTKKIYSTDLYNQSSSSIREVNVCTNMANTGNVPSPGSIPQAKRFHYGAAGSFGNNHRALIFPVGDGYNEFILAANELNNPVPSNTKYSTIISVDKDLGFQWSKKIGVLHSGSIGFLNQVYDMVPCDGSNQSLFAVGTVTTTSNNRDILIARVGGTATLEDCEVIASVNHSALTETANPINLTKLNLNTTDCEDTNSCWADNSLIDNVPMSDITIQAMKLESACMYSGRPDSSEIGGKSGDLDFIVPNLVGSQITQTGLSFAFLKAPKEVYFEITDITGDFVYERFYGNINKLMTGFDFTAMGLDIGDYVWGIEAVYEDEIGIERKVGQFSKN